MDGFSWSLASSTVAWGAKARNGGGLMDHSREWWDMWPYKQSSGVRRATCYGTIYELTRPLRDVLPDWFRKDRDLVTSREPARASLASDLGRYGQKWTLRGKVIPGLRDALSSVLWVGKRQ